VHKSTDFDNPSSTQVIEGQAFLSEESRLLDRYEAQGELAGALERTEFHRHLAEKVLGCHKKFRHFRCDNNHDWAKSTNSCSVRLCPHCSRDKAKTIGTKVQAFVVGKENLKYMVLAERNSKNLAEGIKSLYAAWDKLRRSVFWKRRVTGSMAVLEVTYSVKRKSWHPHLNVLFEGEYIPFKELNLKWQKVTENRGRTSWIQKANEGTVWELVKYTLKVAEYENTSEGRVLKLLFDDPKVLDEFLASVYGVRLIRTYGTFRSMGDVEGEEEKCPDCGSTCFVDLGWAAHHQLKFDFDKQIFRVVRSPGEIITALREGRAFDPSHLDFLIRKQREKIPLAVEARKEFAVYERRVREKFSARSETSLRQPAA
jgi:hypothetical protein